MLKQFESIVVTHYFDLKIKSDPDDDGDKFLDLKSNEKSELRIWDLWDALPFNPSTPGILHLKEGKNAIKTQYDMSLKWKTWQKKVRVELND